MLKVSIRPHARNDIKKIWRYTYDNWGGKQADLYVNSLGQAIEEMADNPEIGSSIGYIREGYRLYHFKHHLVIYSNGDVSFCEMLDAFGNIREKKLEEILVSEKAENMRSLIRKKECFCHHNCNMIDNFFLNPLQYPKLIPRIF